MLVLTRRTSQAIRIGAEVEVRVLEVGDGYVRLGISAPRTIPVHREEVFLEIQESNRAASATLPDAVAQAERTLSPNGHGAASGAPGAG